MPVGLVIVSHSAQLAAGVAELAGQMAQGKVPIAAAGGVGTGENIIGTSADVIFAAIQAVDSPDGVLVLLDLGSAILSAETALEFLDEEQRSRAQFTIAPLVEGAVTAALEASLGHSLAQVKQAAEKMTSREQLRLLKPLSGSEPEVEAEIKEEAAASDEVTAISAGPGEANVLEASLPITNPTGLHARPASLFVQMAAQYDASIQVFAHDKAANATNIIGVLSLGVRQGDTITLRIRGPQAGDALAALSELVNANFYETEPLPVTDTLTAQPAPATQDIPQVDEVNAAASMEAAEIWRGIPTSPGVAHGPAFVAAVDQLSLKGVERRPIAPGQVATEQKRLREALSSAEDELHALAVNLQSSVGQEQAAIFDAQALMLSDETLLEEALNRIVTEHIDAASALASVGEEQAALLEELENALLAARAADVRDSVSRAVRSLLGLPAPTLNLAALTSPVILLARDLTPSDTALLRPETILGICTVLGGPTAHAAILARALGIPAMAGLNEAALAVISTGDELGLDADQGLLYVQPAEQTRAQLVGRIAERQAQQAALRAEAQQDAGLPLTLDGRHISLLANVGSEAEAEAARQWGAEGIGLLRTEFLFAGAPTLPDEEEQRQRYMQVFRAFIGSAPRNAGPVVVRTLDAGADKPMPALQSILGPGTEANPALGLRGIRIHLAHPQLLEQQVSALLRAAVETGIELHVMFPMISTVEEVRAVRAIFDRVYERLQQQGVVLPEHVPLGIMVEVPSAALLAPELAELVDFFSIGANDLLQYTLASDRTNTTVSYLYQAMQPAVLRLIRLIAEAGREVGKSVAVCGEIASDARLAPLLVALGVDELSMTPTALPTVRAALTRRTAQELASLAERVRPLKTVAEVEQELS